MQLVVADLAKAFGAQEVFKNINFMIDKGERVGLIGVNGCGKSTLVNCLLNPDWADGGTVSFEPGLRVGHVEQGFDSIKDESIWNFMVRSCPEILKLRARLAELEKLISTGTESVLQEYARTTQLYEHLDGYGYESRLKRVLLGLAFPEAMWEHNALELSGGQKTRMMLAAALVSAPDFLILDEPTNNLDMQMMEWLEGYLQEFKGGLLIVSHDRAFLDHVTTRILEMEKGKLQSFTGNYSHYLEQKEIQTKTLTAAYNAQQDFIAAQEAYIRRFKAGIKSKMARGRQSRLDRLERLEAPAENEEFNLRLPPASEAAERILIMEDLDVGYSGHPLLKNLNLILRRGEKVALIGPNGTGKTTLLKTLLGILPPLHGKAQIGNRVKLGYFSQSYERLDPEQTLLDNFLTEYGLTDGQTRSLLGGMLFHGDDVFKTIGSLSGGQKARLVLLKLVLDGANCLVLDEPTNHLDILAKETVEAALATFDGTVLLVSHDRYLVQEIADRIWVIEGDEVKDYKGDWKFYQEEKAKVADVVLAGENTRLAKAKTTPAAAADSQVKAANASREAENPETGKQKKKVTGHHSPQELQSLLEKVELSLREQEAMLSVLDKEISIPENQLNLANSRKMAAEREVYVKTIDTLMERWENLLEEQEAAQDE
jgi:ATP-binding cassette subfamily F protein 3